MKILLLSLNHKPEPTGIGKFQGEMASWLAAAGHEVRAIAAPPYYPAWKVGEGYSACRYKVETIDGVKVYRVPLYVPAVPSGLKRIVHLLSFVVMAKPALFWLALSWRPDVILMTAPPLFAAPIALVAGWMARAKTVMHVQDFEVEAAFHLGLLKKAWMLKLALKLERAALRAFDCVSTISPKMREKLIEKGVKLDRAALIPNWANIESFDPAKGAGTWPERLKRSPQTLIALYSGNLGRKQGLETIVEAARLLDGKVDIQFVVSGDGAGRVDMESSAKGLGNITFLPVQPFDDFVHLMLAADIHLLPQKAGAADLVMPSKLGNILASGKPVIVGADAGTQLYEAVQGCGLAVPPEDASLFAAAIEKLAHDVPLRAKLGIEGRTRALTDWSRDGVLRRLEKLLAKS